MKLNESRSVIEYTSNSPSLQLNASLLEIIESVTSIYNEIFKQSNFKLNCLVHHIVQILLILIDIHFIGSS